MGTSCLRDAWGRGRDNRPRSAHSLTVRPGTDQAWLRAGLVTILLLLLAAAPTRATEPLAAIELQVIRPEAQCLALLSLFEGTDWPHPAAALADWKRSAPPGEDRSLGKPLEALIASLNPLMAQELATFDGTRLLLDLDPDGKARWAAIVPKDDGTITALATALVLTDGEREAPEGPFAVDRIGPEGSPLIASAEPGRPVVLASDRETLASAIERVDTGQGGAPEMESGWILRVEPARLADSGSLLGRRIAAAALALGYSTIDAQASLAGERLELAIEGPAGPPDRLPNWGRIDPSWLDLIPADRPVMAASVAITPGGDSWGRFLEVVDRVERADPSRAEVVALRQRLALLGLARGIRLEADFWPNLLGVTAWASLDDSGDPDGGVIALHTPDDRAAERLIAQVVGRLIDEITDSGPLLALLDDQSLRTTRLGSSVLIGWGVSSIAASLEAIEDPERSAGPTLRLAWPEGAHLPSRMFAGWPGRYPGMPSAIREALETAPPAIGVGWTEGESPRDLLHWDGLRAPIQRFLDDLPAEPADGPPTFEKDRP